MSGRDGIDKITDIVDAFGDLSRKVGKTAVDAGVAKGRVTKALDGTVSHTTEDRYERAETRGNTGLTRDQIANMRAQNDMARAQGQELPFPNAVPQQPGQGLYSQPQPVEQPRAHSGFVFHRSGRTAQPQTQMMNGDPDDVIGQNVQSITTARMNNDKAALDQIAANFDGTDILKLPGSPRQPVRYPTGMLNSDNQPVYVVFHGEQIRRDQIDDYINNALAKQGIGVQKTAPAVGQSHPAPQPDPQKPVVYRPDSAPAKPEPEVKFDPQIPAASGADAKIYLTNKAGEKIAHPENVPVIAANQVERVQAMMGANVDGQWGPESQKKFEAMCARAGIKNPHDVNFKDMNDPETKQFIAQVAKEAGAKVAALNGALKDAAKPPVMSADQANLPKGVPLEGSTAVDRSPRDLSAAPTPAVMTGQGPAPEQQVNPATGPRVIEHSTERHNFLQEASNTLGFGGGLSDEQIIAGMEKKLTTLGIKGFQQDGKLDANELGVLARNTDAHQQGIASKNPDMIPALDALLKQEGITKLNGVYTDGKAAENHGPAPTQAVALAQSAEVAQR